MYRLWEVQSVVFYEGLRLWGGSASNGVSVREWSAKEGPHVRGGSELGSYEDLMNVSRILAPGGSICRVLRGSEALGGSFVRVLRGSEALGGRPSNEAGVRGGSAKEIPSRAWGSYGIIWMWDQMASCGIK